MTISPDDPDLVHLLEASDDDFREGVARYLTGDPMPGDHELFRSAELAERTLEAVEHLLQHAQSLRDDPGATADVRRRRKRFAATMRAEREILRPIVGEIRDRRRSEEAGGPRSKAQRILAELHQDEFRQIMRALKAGGDPDDVLRAMRAASS